LIPPFGGAQRELESEKPKTSGNSCDVPNLPSKPNEISSLEDCEIRAAAALEFGDATSIRCYGSWHGTGMEWVAPDARWARSSSSLDLRICRAARSRVALRTPSRELKPTSGYGELIDDFRDWGKRNSFVFFAKNREK